MRALQVVLLSVLMAALSHSLVNAAESKRDFRPLTEKEETIFYPMVCNGSPDDSDLSGTYHAPTPGRTCKKLASNLEETPVADEMQTYILYILSPSPMAATPQPAPMKPS